MKTLGAKLTFTLSFWAYTTKNPHFAHMTRNIPVFSKQCSQWHPEILNGLVSALLEKNQSVTEDFLRFPMDISSFPTKIGTTDTPTRNTRFFLSQGTLLLVGFISINLSTITPTLKFTMNLISLDSLGARMICCWNRNLCHTFESSPGQELN